MCPCGQTGGTRQVSEESGVAIPAPPARGTETLTQQAEPGGPFTRAGPTVSDTPAEAPWDTKLSRARRAPSRLLPRETVSTMTRGGVLHRPLLGWFAAQHGSPEHAVRMECALPFSVLPSFFRLFCPQQSDFTIHQKVAICHGFLSVAM